MNIELQRFRSAKDASMRRADSPLTPTDRASFTGLKYFDPNDELALKLALDTGVPHDPISMETSTGGQRTYKRAGRIKFTVDGVEAVAFVYEDEYGYFLPFRDATSSHESYAAGRYLEPEKNSDGTLRVDFNYAYNPYCAYSPHFSCPLPPIENWLKVPIRAGEKKFHAE